MARILVDLLSMTGSKGGMEIYTRELYQRLGQISDHEFVGFASQEAAAMDTSWFPGHVHDSGISGENRFSWARGELVAVNRAARDHGADLIHAPATLGPPRRKIPLVVTMHDMLYWSHPQYMSTPLYTAPVKYMEKIVSRKADRIITISKASAGEIEKYLSVPQNRITVIHLAGRPLPGVDRSVARSEPALVLGTGNRRPHKNWESLIRALARISENKRPRIALTGSGPDDPLRAVVDELDLRPWVDLYGWIEEDELARVYSRASALAMPSFCEGFSLTPLEGMMSGLPVLISDIEVHHEIAGEAAIYVDPHDLDSIAAGLRRVADEPDLLTDLAERGRSHAAAFSWERTAEETLQVFDDVLARTAS